MNKPTTPKQIKFVRALTRTLCPTEAAMQSFDCKDRKVASVIGSQLLAKLNISFTELLDKAGLGIEKDLEDLKRLRSLKRLHACDVYVSKDSDGNFKINENSNDFIEVDDGAVQLKALEMSLKIKGVLKEKFEHSGKVEGGETRIIIVTPQERKLVGNRVDAISV